MLARKVTILLLGQTGVGKSTLINMLGNYLSEKSVHDIANGKCNLLVPTKFALQDENYEEDIIEVGNSEHEIPGTGQSSTQKPSIYSFNDEKHNVVLEVIDTPGVGDTRGLEYDQKNAEMILNFISELPTLDAICILLKPDVTRLTAEFEMCIKQIFEQLDKNILKNVVFLYTNGRTRNFMSADTDVCLRKLFDDIHRNSKAVIPFDYENQFFIDNESFKYIVGTQQRRSFSATDVFHYDNSFNKSRKNINSFINYIINLSPAPLQGVVSMNESKRMIRRLIEPLIELTTLYEYAISEIEDYTNDLNYHEYDINELKKNMYKIELVPKVTENTQDVSDSNVNISFDFGNIRGFVKSVWKLVTDPLKFIWNVTSKKITNRNVDLVENKVLDQDICAEIKDKESAKKAIQKKIKEMKDICREYDEEIDSILKAIATFSVYIDILGTVGCRDIFTSIMDIVINQYKCTDNQFVVKRFADCLSNYKHIKQRTNCDVKSIDVMNCCQRLFRLKHTGHVFKAIIDEEVHLERIHFIS